jgi:hypothetical protein
MNNSTLEGTSLEVARELKLSLSIADPDVIVDLSKWPEGPSRDHYARTALRIGVLALRQASGTIDADTVKNAGNKLLQDLKAELEGGSKALLANLKTELIRYFDPKTGQLPQRLERLLQKDGELEQALTRHVGGDNSTLASTLARKIGTESEIFRKLDPKHKESLLASLQETLQLILAQQRDAMLSQFSLDEPESALSLLVTKIASENGTLKKDLVENLERVKGEFSLDNEDGALARLVKSVELAREGIDAQFSLDNEASAMSRMTKLLQRTSGAIDERLTLDDPQSPLSRLKLELTQILNDVKKSTADFQQEVRIAIASMQTRKQEQKRSTQGGNEFQDAVGAFLDQEARQGGDLFQDVGQTTGALRNSKVGDHVLTMGAESAAAGAKIVVEAKQKKGRDLKSAIDELLIARQNRQAQVGLFVFSRLHAPQGLAPLSRHGQDIVCVWDADDPTSDVYLHAAVSLAKALAVRERVASQQETADFGAIDKAIAEVTRAIAHLDDIKTMAETVASNGEKIGARVKTFRNTLDRELATLSDHIGRLKVSADVGQ